MSFEINIFSRQKEFHRFSTDDFALLEMGIGNYTTSSLQNYFKDPISPDKKEYFNIGTSSTDFIDKLTGNKLEDSMELLMYDEDAKKYRFKKKFSEIIKINSTKYPKHTQPSDKLSTFLDKWKDIQLETETDDELIAGYKLVANRIQNSASGCITFNPNITILKHSRNPLIRLYILNYKDNDSSRTISINGAPLITTIPQSADGVRYGHTNTLNAGVGVYSPPSNDPNNPKDKVSGELRLAYDPVTGTFESGTQQILARLIDNIDAVEIPELTAEQLENLTQEQTYNVNPSDNPVMGKVKWGKALVLSTENGNPNQFGPNFRGGCKNTNKKTIIRAVNRSQKSYKTGTLVVCSLINGEWIIVSGEGTPEQNKKSLTFGRFEFQQYIIPTNLYFTSPQDAGRLLPNTWIQKIRGHYYSKDFIGDNTISNGTRLINIIAQNIPEDSSNPSQYVIDTYRKYKQNDLETVSTIKSAFSDATDFKIDGKRPITFLRDNYLKDTDLFHYVPPTGHASFGVPKNITARSYKSKTLPLTSNSLIQYGAAEDPVDKHEVPLFWGPLFSDGYLAGQASKYLTKLKDLVIYNNDANLKELTTMASSSLPYIDTDEKTLQYAFADTSFNNKIKNIKINPLNFVRKTGGIYKPSYLFASTFDSYNNLNKYISMELDTANDNYSNVLTSDIYGLEPLNPRRLQFSPLSIETMYWFSVLTSSSVTDHFKKLRESRDILYNTILPDKTTPPSTNKYTDYMQYLWGYSRKYYTPRIEDSSFAGSSHQIKALSFEHSFGSASTRQKIFNRHISPVQVIDDIIPDYPFGLGRKRGPCMPIIAIKSVIKTNSGGLTFTLPQLFGNVQRVNAAAGGGGGFTFLPIGGVGIAFGVPPKPPENYGFPQWGDANRTDDIDSFGTLALHVVAYEHWPEQQTIFLGPIYTPLHFNPSDTEIQYSYSYSADNGVTRTAKKDSNNNTIPTLCSVDFKEPTLMEVKDNTTTIKDIAPLGTEITTNNLAPFSEWKYNTQRRAKLLSGGGFAYERKVIFIKDVLLKDGGKDYAKDDEFLLQDGSIIKVTSVTTEGKIDGLSFITNFTLISETQYLVNDLSKYQDITSLNIFPDYAGLEGDGAEFELKFSIGLVFGLDEAPKRLTPITRLTSSSDYGSTRIDKINTVTVTWPTTSITQKEYDLFYFFHNDPTFYSLGISPNVFSSPEAQYVISEVNPL